MAAPSRRTTSGIAIVLIVLAGVLIVTHLVLDAGQGREAPPGLLYLAIGFAVAGIFAGAAGRKNKS